jgi:hypothetical protein
MGKNRGKRRQVTTAERGNIVQRVLVDGWSTAEAAARFGVGERRVAIWVAAYRRHGMTSLRDARGAAIDRAPQRWLWLLRILGARLAAGLRGRLQGKPAVRSVRSLRRGGNVPDVPDNPDRRSRWN